MPAGLPWLAARLVQGMVATMSLQVTATFTRGQIQDAICAWRDGQTYDAIHPLADRPQILLFWDDNAIKDLARVIAHTLNGDTPPSVDLPWS